MEANNFEPLKKRSVVAFLLLTPITLGIYGIYTLYKIGEACNMICEGDDEHCMNYVGAFFLGFVTLGIYPLYWMYKVTKRFYNNAYRYQANVENSPTSFIVWMLLGSFVLGIGSIIAQIEFFANYNAYVNVYGRVKPMPYDPVMAGKPFVPQPVYGYNQAPAQPQPQPQPHPQPQQQPQLGYGYSQAPAQPQPQPGFGYNQAPAQPQPQPGYGYNPGPAPSNGGSAVAAVPPTRGKTNLSTGFVKGISGEYDGFPFEIRNNEEIVIGRDPTRCSIVLSDSNISGCHVQIKYNGVNNTYRVTDMSTNGTFVNGNRLPKGESYTLPVGTVISLSSDGNNAFKFE